ncbi:MAG: hypothetical protein Q9M28_09345 [Mariprofundaceae bacterium]|nr:hypothetical protein [Mariprofundaceae bacterium]
MSLQNTLKEVSETIGETLACSIVDLSTGMALETYHTIPYFTQAYIDAVSAAAVDLFRGKNLYIVEEMLALKRGEPLCFHLKDIQITSTSTYHFISVIKDHPNTIFVLVTNKKVNIGLGWACTKQACQELNKIL